MTTFRGRIDPRAIVSLLKETVLGWNRGDPTLHAASIAFHGVVSLAPLLLLSISIASLAFDEAAVKGEIVTAIEGTVGPEAAMIIQDIIRDTSAGNTDVTMTVVSIVLLLLGASGLFGQLRKSLNLTWGIAPRPGQGVVQGIKASLRVRALAFALVLATGSLLLASLAINALLAIPEKQLLIWLPELAGYQPLTRFVVTPVLTTVLFAAVYRVLPDADIAWRDVWLGAFVTALLSITGTYLIGLYLSRISAESPYGAAGALIVILVWIYYSALILLFGAVFTQVYANTHGSRVVPRRKIAPQDEV